MAIQKRNDSAMNLPSSILLASKRASSDMGFGTNSLVSGMAFGLMGKTLNLFTDRHWEVVDKKDRVIAHGQPEELVGAKVTSDGFEITFTAEKGKRWLRVMDQAGVLPWMGKRSLVDSIDGLILYWKSADHSKVLTEQKVISSPVKYLGGAGNSLKVGGLGTLWITPTGFGLKIDDNFWHRSFKDLNGIQIGGRGIYTTGGGWVGGGVGFTGAMQGAAMASMLNLLETRVHNDCLMRLTFGDAELNFQVLDLTPTNLELSMAAVRIYLQTELGITSTSTMGLQGTMGAKKLSSEKDLKTKLLELKSALDAGLIDHSEYTNKREKLLGDL